MKKILVLIYSLFILLILFLDSPLLNNVFDHILLNLVISIVILKNYKFNKNRKIIILNFILSIILFLMLSYRGVLASDLYLTSPMKVIYFTIIPLIIISSLFINVSFLIDNKDKLLIDSSKPANKDIIKRIFKVIVVLAILSCFSNIRYLNYNDFQRLAYWYKIGEWHTGHTIAWQIIFNLIYKISPMSWGIQIFNTILYLFAIRYVLDVVNNNFGKKALIVFTVLSILFMHPILYLSLPYKDVAFSTSFLAITAVFINVIKTKNISKIDLVYLFVYGLLFSNIRHMMWIGFMLEAFVFFLYFKKNKINYKSYNLVVLVIFILTVFLTYITPTFIIENKDRKAYFASAHPVFNAITFYIEGYEFSEEELNILKTYAPLEVFEKKYEEYNMDSVASGFRMKDYVYNIEKYNIGPDIMKMNFRLFKDHPIKYINLMFRNNSIVYDIADPQNGILSTHIADDGKWDDNHVENYTYLSKLHMLNLNFCKDLKETPVIGDIFFRGGFYTFVFLLYIILDFVNKRKEKLFLFIPIIIMYGVFFLALPSQETRYILPCIYVFPIVTIYTLEKSKKTNRN